MCIEWKIIYCKCIDSLRTVSRFNANSIQQVFVYLYVVCM